MGKMVFKCLVFCCTSIWLSIEARPEAPLPYYYASPSVEQNIFPQTNTGQTTRQQTNIIPSNSYGTPILRSSVQNSALSLTRNYGTPDYLPPSHYRVQQEPVVNVQKHFYVHVPPPDVEERRIEKIQQQPVVQKHYKIIFVKVPAQPGPVQYIAQQQALQEEKTLIYVLVKKPENTPQVVANQIIQQPVNKPEVYFIKYKAKSDENVPVPIAGEVETNDDSVVVESAAGRNALGQKQGYNYDRPNRAFN